MWSISMAAAHSCMKRARISFMQNRRNESARFSLALRLKLFNKRIYTMNTSYCRTAAKPFETAKNVQWISETNKTNCCDISFVSRGKNYTFSMGFNLKMPNTSRSDFVQRFPFGIRKRNRTKNRATEQNTHTHTLEVCTRDLECDSIGIERWAIHFALRFKLVHYA